MIPSPQGDERRLSFITGYPICRLSFLSRDNTCLSRPSNPRLSLPLPQQPRTNEMPPTSVRRRAGRQDGCPGCRFEKVPQKVRWMGTGEKSRALLPPLPRIRTGNVPNTLIIRRCNLYTAETTEAPMITWHGRRRPILDLTRNTRGDSFVKSVELFCHTFDSSDGRNVCFCLFQKGD